MDINNDGKMDMLAAGFGGFCYVFMGKKDGSISKDQVLKDKNGKQIQCGSYYDFKAKGYADDKSVSKKLRMEYAKAVDWDNDGDLDLIFSGGFYTKLRINEGNKNSPKFATKDIDLSEVGGVLVFDAVDWDEDGLFDLMISDKKGNVSYIKNIGKLGHPKFGKPTTIIETKQLLDKKNGGTICSTEICTADYNNDGKLDLIIGCKNHIKNIGFKLTEKDKTEIKEYKKQVEVYTKKLNGIYQKYLKKYKTREIALKHYRLDKEQENTYRDRAILYGKISSYNKETIPHGYVYVSLRK